MSAAGRCTPTIFRCRPMPCTPPSASARIAHGRIRDAGSGAGAGTAWRGRRRGGGDIPGENNYGSVLHDDPIFADGLVQYAGQPLFAVARDQSYAGGAQGGARARASSTSRCRRSWTFARRSPRRATCCRPSAWCAAGRTRCWRRRRIGCGARCCIGGQDHFYLEGQIAIALPQEDGAMLIHSSTQHPSEVQQIVAHALARRCARR